MNLRDRKWQFAQAALKRGSLFVHFDPSKATVPPLYSDESSLVLQFGYNMARPMRDLEVSNWVISGTLSFGGKPFHCVVPWHSVHAMADDTGRGERYAPEPAPKPGRPARRTATGKMLRVIDGGLSDGSDVA